MRDRRHRPLASALALCALLALACVPAASARSPTPLDLALRFQPHLFFDSTEPWRPLDVDAFLAEPGHGACVSAPGGSPACTPLTSIAQLTPPVDQLDLRGVQPDGSDAAAPDVQSCAKSKPELLECDEAVRSIIYAHVRRRGTRTAIDYWWFLRYNDFLVDQHEGDWEGVTVLVDATRTHVAETHFAAHADIWRYGDRISRLDGGRHVRVYVARGGHAAYPRPCRRQAMRADGERAAGGALRRRQPVDRQRPGDLRTPLRPAAAGGRWQAGVVGRVGRPLGNERAQLLRRRRPRPSSGATSGRSRHRAARGAASPADRPGSQQVPSDRSGESQRRPAP